MRHKKYDSGDPTVLINEDAACMQHPHFYAIG